MSTKANVMTHCGKLARPIVTVATVGLDNETPGVSFITVAYAQNGAESGVRDFSRQGCDL